MSPSIWFLGVAVLVSLVGTAIVAWRHRTPQHFESSIDDFTQRMSTLAPPADAADGSGVGADSDPAGDSSPDATSGDADATDDAQPAAPIGRRVVPVPIEPTPAEASLSEPTLTEEDAGGT